MSSAVEVLDLYSYDGRERAASSSACSSRSFPQNISSPTMKVGAPKMPSAVARSVVARRRGFQLCDVASSRIAGPS